MRFSILFVCAALAVSGLAQADILTVDDDLVDLPTADYTLLQDAIDAAVTGDEIVVCPGTYEEELEVKGKIITIRSTDPSDPLVVDATDIEPDGRFEIGRTMPATSGVTLRGLKFSRFNGSQTQAATVFGGVATFIMEDCVVFNFPDPAGFGSSSGVVEIACDGATVARSAFTGNGNPGLQISGNNVMVEECVFSDSLFGAIVIAPGGTDNTVRQCSFLQNGEGAEGALMGQAPVYVRDAHGTLISDCLFQENYGMNGTVTGGGGVRAFESGNSASRPFVVERTRFYSNIVTDGGGVSSNSSGGAINALSSDVTISDCVFVGNEVVSTGTFDARGGALSVTGTTETGPSEVRVLNSTFFDNGAIANGSGSQFGGAINASGIAAVDVENSIFRSNGPGGIFSGNVTFNSSLTSGNPIFVENPDGKGNGWTDDPATGTNEAANNDYGDLRLADGSPAINAGDNSEVISTTDLDGDLRIRGGLVDQGAYESRYARYFVDASVATSGNALEWGEAVQTLAELPIDGGEAEVRIAEGTYVVPAGGFELGTGAWIRGGYNPGGGGLNPNNNPVVLTGDINGDDLPDGVNRGDNATHVLWSDTASDVTIDGVTLSGANSDGLGGGTRLINVLNLSILDVIIEDNDARRGGGVAIRGGDGVMTDTIVRNNRGSRENGGMRVDGGATMVIQNSEFRDNSAIEECGGAGFYNGANAFVNNSVFADNTSALDVGGVEVSNDTNNDPAYVELFNTIITGNSAAGEASGVRYAQDASGVISR